jgi:hypothetical protein
MWKIKNTNSNPVKIAVAKSNTVTVGIFLKPGEFCVCDSRMTASIDAQERRKFIEVDRSFDNNLKLKLGEVYNESALIKAAEETDKYTKTS